MAKLLKAGVIGCGRMGAFTSEKVKKFAPNHYFPLSHTEAILAHNRIKIVGLNDVSNENLLKAGEHYGIKDLFIDFDDFIKQTNPDLICLATRTNIRADLIKKISTYGINHVHLEKPLCNSVNELRELEKIFSEDSRYFTWGAIRRHLTVYKQALQIAESNEYGKLLEIRVNFGAGKLLWTHPHSIDLILWAAGERKLEFVQAKLEELKNPEKTSKIENDPTILSSTFYFSDNLIANISRGNGMDLVLSCEDADIVVLADGHELLLYSKENGGYSSYKKIEINKSNLNGTLAALDHLVKCFDKDQMHIALNKKLKKDILKSTEITFAMIQSHLLGSKPISLNDVDEDICILGKSGNFYA